MAHFEYPGLEGRLKGGALWAGIGVLFSIGGRIPALWIPLALVMGIVLGAASAHLLSRLKTRELVITGWVGLGSALAVAALLYLSGNHPEIRPMAAVAFVALYLAGYWILFGILGPLAMKKLNEDYKDVREALTPPKKKLGPPIASSEPSATSPQVSLNAFAAGLPEPMASEARACFQPVIRAVPFRSIEALPPDASQLSGAPLLPPAQAWPNHNGKPLAFLAQINLAELPPSDHRRPESGLLSFFIDVDDPPWGTDADDLGRSLVLFHPDSSRLSPTLEPGTGKHPPLRKPLSFQQQSEFCPSSDFQKRYWDHLQGMDDDESEALDSHYHDLTESTFDDSHRVLSSPLAVQNDMGDDLETAAGIIGLPSGTEWTMLLQLDSDRDLGWCWGDAGCLYFWIPTEDLANARFDRVWVILQCT